MIPFTGSGGGTLRFREGNVTTVLHGDLKGFVRAALTAAAGAVVEVLEAEARVVQQAARADWYGPNGVTRETGASGQIEVVTTVSATEVRVGLLSTDERRTNKGLLAYVMRRPSRLSLVRKEVTNAEWWATPKAMRANYKPRRAGRGNEADPPGVGPFVYVPNPKASDGKQMMGEVVRKPFTVRFSVINPKLEAAILANVEKL